MTSHSLIYGLFNGNFRATVTLWHQQQELAVQVFPSCRLVTPGIVLRLGGSILSLMWELAAATPVPDSTDGPSTSGRRVVISRHEIPLDLLVARHDPRKVPSSAVPGHREIRQARKNAAWAQSREQLLAAAAAGFHLALFAWNLAFWGFEGMPPDRYWPDNPRFKYGNVPGRYGNLHGAKKLWYSYLQAIEGQPPK